VHDKLTTNSRFTDGDLRCGLRRVRVAIALSERVARDTVRRRLQLRRERGRLALGCTTEPTKR
jgi:hypothetical protein